MDAKCDKLLSNTALPAITIFSLCNVILLKFLPSLITTPSNRSSVIKIFEPAPSINSLSWLLRVLRKLMSWFRWSALKNTLDLPPILNQFFFF